MPEIQPKTTGFRLIRWGGAALAAVLLVIASGAVGFWLHGAESPNSEGNHSQPGKSFLDQPENSATNDQGVLEPWTPDSLRDDNDPQRLSNSDTQPGNTPPPGLEFEQSQGRLSEQSGRSLVPTNTPGELPVNLKDSLTWTNLLASTDEAYLGGDYAHALRSYRALLAQTEGNGKSLLMLRIGLCAEATGNYREAIEVYRSLQQRESDPTTSAAARLAELRCLGELPETAWMPHEVYRDLLVDQSSLPTRIRHEMMHTVARGLLSQQIPMNAVDLLKPTSMALPIYRSQPQTALTDLALHLRQESPHFVEFGLEVLQHSDETPDGIYLRVHSPAADVANLLRELGARSGFDVVVSPGATVILKGRSQVISVSDQSLSLLLDGLTIPFGCTWAIEDSAIRIVARDELDAASRESFTRVFAERLLRASLLDAPASAQADYTRVGLAILQFQQGLTADAAHTLRTQMETSPRSLVLPEAAFNLAKCELALHQAEAAHAAFLMCLDSHAGNPDLVIVSYLYAGSMLMELEQFRAANSYWTRGLSLAAHTRFEATAALLLASGLLLAGSEHGANSVLMEHRSSFSTESDRDAAAFLSAFARFRSAVLENRKEREGRSLVAALTHFNAQLQFGHHWSLIKGDAFQELGLPDEAITAYQALVSDAIALPIRRRGVIRIARQWRTDGRTDEASQLLASVSLNSDREASTTDGSPTNSVSGEMESQAAVDVAEILLSSGDTTQAISECRRILPLLTSDDARRRALRTMGRAYQQQKDYQAAVQCFTGIVPVLPQEPTAVPTDSSSDNAQSPRRDR